MKVVFSLGGFFLGSSLSSWTWSLVASEGETGYSERRGSGMSVSMHTHSIATFCGRSVGFSSEGPFKVYVTASCCAS